MLKNDCYVCSSCLRMFLANCGYLELVLVFFIMNSPLQFCIMGLIPVMITNLVRGSRMTVAGSKILVRSRQVDVMTLALFWKRVVFCNQLLRSWFLSFILLS